MIQITQQIKVLTKESNAYTVEGNSGISNKIRALVNDSIFVFKFKDDAMKLFNELPSKGEVNVTMQLSSPKENLKLDIISIETKK